MTLRRGKPGVAANHRPSLAESSGQREYHGTLACTVGTCLLFRLGFFYVWGLELGLCYYTLC